METKTSQEQWYLDLTMRSRIVHPVYNQIIVFFIRSSQET